MAASASRCGRATASGPRHGCDSAASMRLRRCGAAASSANRGTTAAALRASKIPSTTSSPPQNVRAGVSYPPLLVLTADNDDRVAPAHAYKFVATMQDRSPASETYLRVERRAGHGAGNALSKTLDRDSDTIAFLCEKLGG